MLQGLTSVEPVMCVFHLHPPPTSTLRLRDLSNQEKLENQRLVKDFEKQMSALTSVKEQKDRLEEELKVNTHTLQSSPPVT